jgi:hypothetical protein
MKYDIPSEFKPFLNSVKRQCKTYGVELMLSPSTHVVVMDNFKEQCSGYFDGDDKVLVVACGKPVHVWMEILAHEFSHMEQWKSDDRWGKWDGAALKLWSWMDNSAIMNKKQLSNVLDDMIELELDCEMRAVEIIKKWNLPLNIPKYIQKANIYLYSYALMSHLKHFPTDIYKDENLIKLVPSTFMKSYRKPKKELADYIVNKFAKK